jgi:hypothetical protein
VVLWFNLKELGGGIMKRIMISAVLVTVVCVLCTVNAYSQAGKYFTDVVIKASVVQDPGFSAPNVKLVPVKRNLQWIQVDIDYSTVARKNRKTKATAWLENLVMKYAVLLPKVSGKSRVVISGKVEYWGIPMDGEKHHAQVFIHPQILKRYLPDMKLSKSKMKDLRLLLTFELNESAIAYGVLKPRSTTKSNDIKREIDRALGTPSTRKVKNAIYNRSETPWGIINLSYYELIKRKN